MFFQEILSHALTIFYSKLVWNSKTYFFNQSFSDESWFSDILCGNMTSVWPGLEKYLMSPYAPSNSKINSPMQIRYKSSKQINNLIEKKPMSILCMYIELQISLVWNDSETFACHHTYGHFRNTYVFITVKWNIMSPFSPRLWRSKSLQWHEMVENHTLMATW